MYFNNLSNENKKQILNFFICKQTNLNYITLKNKNSKSLKKLFFKIIKKNCILKLNTFLKNNEIIFSNRVDDTYLTNIFVDSNNIKNIFENYLFKFYLKIIQLRRYSFFKKKFKKKIKKRFYFFFKRIIKMYIMSKKPIKISNLSFIEPSEDSLKNIFNKIHLFETNKILTKQNKKVYFFFKASPFLKDKNFKKNVPINLILNTKKEFEFENIFLLVHIHVKKNLFLINKNIDYTNTWFKSIRKLRWKRHWYKKKLLKYKFKYKQRVKLKKTKYSLFSKKNFKRLFFFNYSRLLKKNKNINLTSILTKFNLFNKHINIKNKSIVRKYTLYPTQENNFNNFFPIYKVNVNKKKIINLFYSYKLQPYYNEYYNFYLLNFLELFLKQKVWIKICNKSLVPKKVVRYLKKLFKKNKSYQNKIGRYFYLLEFYEILYISIFYRDLHFFANWFKKIMEKLHIRKHKKLLKIIKYTLRDYKFLSLLNAIGFMMDVRGKLGAAGNSKKKHYSFTVGHVSFTTKNHDLVLVQTTVRTSTGVLGVSMFLSH